MKVIIDENAIKDLSKLDKKLTKKIFSKIEELQNFPKATLYEIPTYFSEDFFETKKVVHIPLKYKP